jgi:hypothetical protein
MPQRLINVQLLLHDSHNDRPAFLSSPLYEIRLGLVALIECYCSYLADK